MEYSFRSLDPRDLRGDDVNFYLTGQAVDNRANREPVYTTSQSVVYNGLRDGVLYRQAIMRKPPNNGIGYIIDLAEIHVPGGVIRIDRSRLAFEHALTLGHFGMPHIDGNAAETSDRSDDHKMVLTASIHDRKTAMIAYHGWDELNCMVHVGHNAEAEESTVLFAKKSRLMKNPPMELMITVLLHKADQSDWSSEELDPVASYEIMDYSPGGSVLGANIVLRNGDAYLVDFKDIDGLRTC